MNSICIYKYHTGSFMKKVLSVYTHLMTTIYLSLSAQIAISTFFMKSPLGDVTALFLFLRRVTITFKRQYEIYLLKGSNVRF